MRSSPASTTAAFRPGEAQQLRGVWIASWAAEGWGELLLTGSRSEVSGPVLRTARCSPSRAAVEATQPCRGPGGAHPTGARRDSA